MRGLLQRYPAFVVCEVCDSMDHMARALRAAPPDVAIVSSLFVQSTEFYPISQFMLASDIRWLALAPRDRRRAPQQAGAAGLFELDQMASPDQIAKQIIAVSRSRRGIKRPEKGKIVMIGASTGGIDALSQVLADYGPDSPPALVVQHTGAGFRQSLVRLLDSRCAGRVVAGVAGQPLAKGTVYVATAPDQHMTLTAGSACEIGQTEAPTDSPHRPSVDVLFRSGQPVAPRILSVLLSGMGRDGAEGMLALARAGATTIAQDEATSTVYGMPRVAAEIGAAQHVLPVHAIAQVVGAGTLSQVRN